MAINTKIVDAAGNAHEAAVTSGNALLVTPTNFTMIENKGSSSRKRLLSNYLGTTGLGSGTTSANVNGATTTQKFYAESEDEYDIMIMKILIYIQDNTVSHSSFGAIAALTNGIDIVVIENGVETYVINAAKTFANLIEQTFAERPWGDTATSFELQSVSGASDAQILPFDIGALIPGGLRIGRGTNDRIELRVNDDLTGLEEFTVRIAGYKFYPPIPFKPED